jgi:hypothetical protein
MAKGEQDRRHRETRRLDEEREPPPPDQRAFPPAGPNKQQDDTEEGRDRDVHGRYCWQINLHASARSGQGAAAEPILGFFTTRFMARLKF